ncbi:DUF748 domain-containing protein [Amphritea sp. 2_MG-2023]|uniref:DUF748 domain-containing protein n=1 Tax=Amphritea TaxID=515417 RepID=UPI001C078203|nr:MULTISPECIES: DUF748 domain-containing protein [Amphritea]MBU2967124.1 DUF748 domain-containing protein [Amphritea atlantica]MDO6419323.1 DUF748 domain-containing protein [Amphritea sp. 2_MG-2023]
MSVKGFLRGSVIAALVIFLLLHTAVQVGRDFAIQWLLDQGASEARIHRLSINWFTGGVTLSGVAVITPEQPDLRLDRLQVDIDYPALFEQRILISDLTLEGVALYLHEQTSTEQRQFYLGPVALPNSAEASVEEVESEPSAWQFGLARVRVSDFSWRSQLQEGDHRLRIDNAALDTFYTWQEDAITHLSIQGAINGAGFNLNTEGQPLPQTKRSELHLKLEQLPLHPFTAPFVPELQATLSTDLTLTIVAGEQISISQSGDIQLDDFAWKQEGLAVSQRSLTWKGKTAFTMSGGKPEALNVDGKLDLSALGLMAKGMQVDLKGAGWQGNTDLIFAANGIDKIGVSGQLALSALGLEAEGMHVDLGKADWKGDTDLNFTADGMENLGVSGNLTLATLGVVGEGMNVQLSDAGWQGSSAVSFNATGADKVNLDGQLKAAELRYQMPERLQAQVNAIDWQGELALLLQQQPLAIQGEKGQLALSGVDVKALQGDQTLVSLTQARLTGIGLSLPKKITLGKLSAAGLMVSPQVDDTLAQLDLNVSDVDFTLGEYLTIAQVELQNLKVREQLSAEKQPVNVTRLQAGLSRLTPAAEGNTADTPSSDEAALRVQVKKLLVSGESQVSFTDNSTTPPFASEILIAKAQLLGLDTGSRTPAQFELGLKFNNFTTFDLSGDTDMAGGGANANWEGALKQLDLPRLSPYSIEYTGYYLQNGQMALNSSGQLDDGNITGKNEIKIHRLDVEPADKQQMAKFSKQLSMPLGTAISVLQDGDDNIDLDIPISGSLDDPDFGLQSVVTRLAGKGLKKAAFSILLKSLQPYGTLISLAAGAVSEGNFINLDPVVFAPGGVELDDYAQGYLTKIEGMMAERKGMRLNICGQAVQQDLTLIRAALEEQNSERKKPFTAEELLALEQQQLVDLAQQRADLIKQQLTTKIAGERIFSCFPVPSLDDPKAKPSATLGL